jgi:membrane protease YdiL (CAAX protease family)
MHILDHLFVILLVVVVPILGFRSIRKLRQRAAGGGQIDRSRLYLATAANHWLLFFLAMLGWAFSGRPWSAIGVSLDLDRNFIIGVILLLTAVAFLLFQIYQVRKADRDELLRIRNSFAKVSLLMPRNGNELGRFYGLSVTAGIVEEILWRGFLIWYFSQYLPLWAAALLVTLSFGLAHAYQGLAQLPAVTLVGALFAGLYLLTGSVWLPMLLHAAVDVLQGRLAYEVLHRSEFGDADFDGDDALITM